MSIQNIQIETAAKKQQAANTDPMTLTGEGVFYVKLVEGKTEGFFIDDDGNSVQLTSNGGLNIGTTIASAIDIELRNGSSSGLSSLQPVSVDAAGKAVAVDVSNEALCKAFTGITFQGSALNQPVDVVTGGLLENIGTSAAFGSLLYVNKSGGLTNVPPDIGVGGFVAGDWVILVGKIAQNLATPAQKDLIVTPTVIAQL